MLPKAKYSPAYQMNRAISAKAIRRTSARRLNSENTAALRSPHVDDLHAPIARSVRRIRLRVARLRRADAGPGESCRVVAALLQDRDHADGAFARQLEVVLEPQRLDWLAVGVA